MWRHRSSCNHCIKVSTWYRHRQESEQEIHTHLSQAHGMVEPRESRDYQTIEQRQCDYCLEPYLDHCTKCNRDFCRIHAGDIDGLCGGCI